MISHLTSADFAEPSLAQDPVHPEGVLGHRLRFQPLPLQVAVEVHRPFELAEGRSSEEALHATHAQFE